ncbi:MAG: glycosyltransferase family 4 protein [Desulfovibrio sp.]|nr:glycosyltransferase family 4 protein [Desulfovibrio sp.]
MQAMPSSPLAPGQPHTAIVLLWYPLFTQPFIFREIETLSGVAPVEIYTLYGRNLRHCSSEMKKAGNRGRAYGSRKVLAICLELMRQGLRHPRRLWRLAKRSLWRKWPSLETFGENLWGFCVGVTLGRQFREDGIDFVYAPWPRGAATAAWVGASIAGLPFGIAARGDNLEPADPDLNDKLAAAQVIRANNAADQARIEDRIAKSGLASAKTALIYNSLTLKPESGGARFQGPELRLLALGRFDVTKGFDVLLRACALLKQQGVKFRLTLAGGGGRVMGLGQMDKILRGLREELRLEAEVDLPGLVSHDALPGLLNSHDIFVAPCVIDPSGRRDGIPNTVIEALAFGMPVIATDVNALPEIVRNGSTGLTVPQKDPAALAKAIARLKNDPGLAMRLGRNGAQLAASLFDPDKNASRLAAMLKTAHADWKRTCAA